MHIFKTFVIACKQIINKENTPFKTLFLISWYVLLYIFSLGKNKTQQRKNLKSVDILIQIRKDQMKFKQMMTIYGIQMYILIIIQCWLKWTIFKLIIVDNKLMMLLQKTKTRPKDKQWYTKLNIENYKVSNTNPNKNLKEDPRFSRRVGNPVPYVAPYQHVCIWAANS